MNSANLDRAFSVDLLTFWERHASGSQGLNEGLE